MTDLKDWTKLIELDYPKEAQKLYDVINTYTGNNVFVVSQINNSGSMVYEIQKKGFPKKLEIKSDQAKNKMLEMLTDDYLPLGSLR